MPKGLVHIYTGEGKGKTTASVGLAARAAGQGFRVLFCQFLKEDSAPSGEKEFFKGSNFKIEVLRSNCRHPIFTKGKTDAEFVRERITATFATMKEKVAVGVDLVVLDEIMSVVNGGWISVNDMLDFLDARPSHLEVVLTGRDAPVELTRAADYVTEMLKIKHPYDRGVNARKGIEF